MNQRRLNIIFHATKDIKKRIRAWKAYCKESMRPTEDRFSDELLYSECIDKDFIDLGYSASDVDMPSFARAFEHLYYDIWQDIVWKEIEYKTKYYQE
tara:strand:+ start:189 stop:479 length:291 start_codon:yes stop_codon:yes gene_type:complete